MHRDMKVADVDLCKLKEHPRQSEFFPPKSESEVDELAGDLKHRGQQEPVHCTADFTIIRGHGRVAAARQLEWPTIRAVIRHDLGKPTSDEAINEMLSDNLLRQHLDELTLARCYRQLKRSRSRSATGEGDARDQLAARLGCGKSGRSLDRLERLLDLPLELQHMISRGELTKSQGELILRLSKQRQLRLVRLIEQGIPVKKALQDLGIVTSVAKDEPAQVGRTLLTLFNKHLDQLREHLDQLDTVQVAGGREVQVLDDGIAFLESWRERKQTLHLRSLEEILPPKVGFRSRTN